MQTTIERLRASKDQATEADYERGHKAGEKWANEASKSAELRRLKDTVAEAKSNKILVVLLRLWGVIALFALVPVLMPMSWMVAIHRWIGMGAMPSAPAVEYLARTISAFYVMTGAICLFIAGDIERYRPVAWFLGVAQMVMGAVFVGIDMAAGMPIWWTALEGPSEIIVGAAIMLLARGSQRLSN